MKSPAYAPDLLLENWDQMVLCTQGEFTPGYIYWKKMEGGIISLVVIRFTFVIRAP